MCNTNSIAYCYKMGRFISQMHMISNSYAFVFSNLPKLKVNYK
jgi:hypothetical protein